jgi:hypothetical protein
MTRATLSFWRRSFSRGGDREPLCRSPFAPSPDPSLPPDRGRDVRGTCGTGRIPERPAAGPNPPGVRAGWGLRWGTPAAFRTRAQVSQKTLGSTGCPSGPGKTHGPSSRPARRPSICCWSRCFVRASASCWETSTRRSRLPFDALITFVFRAPHVLRKRLLSSLWLAERALALDPALQHRGPGR